MIRAVLAVIASVALLAASLPAVDDARRQHTDGVVREELEDVERAARTLAETNDAVEGLGARRVVTVRVPERSWAHAGLAALVFDEGRGGSGCRFVWTVDGGRRTVYRIDGLALRTAGGDPLSVRGPGRHRLVLTLDGTRRGPVVTVRRFEPGGPRRATIQDG